MKKILTILMFVALVGCSNNVIKPNREFNNELPGTDSLRTYNNKFIRNTHTSFTNLRFDSLHYGIIDWIDSARMGLCDTAYMLNDTTLLFRMDGVYRKYIIKNK